MGLTGQVRGGQVRVDISSVRGTVVMEGVRGLSGDGRGDVGLLAPVTSVSLGDHVLLSLEDKSRNQSQTVILLDWTSTTAPIPQTTRQKVDSERMARLNSPSLETAPCFHVPG